MAGPVIEGIRIEDRVGIAAPAETAWAVVRAFERWGEWNPLYTATAGALTVGERIAITVVLPEMKPYRGRATVTLVDPPRRLHYQLRNLGGLMVATRYIEIEPDGPDACTLVNGEVMSGPIGRLIGRKMAPRVRAGIEGMSAAFKRRAEQTTA